jgi:integrase
MLAGILEPINRNAAVPPCSLRWGQFVREVYLPFYARKWKRSTLECNMDRVERQLMPVLEGRRLDSVKRGELQNLLDQKVAVGLAYTTVAHLRWDLRQIFALAVAERCLECNPAELLFVPAGAPRPEKRFMNWDEVHTFFSVLELREKVIGGLALLAGLRPGEIFALTLAHLGPGYVKIQQGIYRGRTGTPKTFKSRRWATLGDGLTGWIEQWLERLPDRRPTAWLFPSERLVTPLFPDCCWRRHFLPRLRTVGLEWANYQILRRSHACLMSELEIDPQIRAEQMGHSVDVNMNEYTRTSLGRRQAAVQALEGALGIQPSCS